jgi:hypothetical protein
MPRTTEIASKNLKPGVNYRMVHSRKGEAVVKCEEPAPDGGTFIVIEGELRGIHDFYGPGDRFTTVNNLAKFYREKPTTAKNVKQRTTKPIPMEEFGKDHWSTFAYVETLVVEGEQPRRERMRCDADRHPQFAHGEFKDKFPTRTKKGEVKNHDDWDCLDDCELVGLIENTGTNLHRVYKLTTLGWTVASQLRQHKADGGNFHSFVPKV